MIRFNPPNLRSAKMIVLDTETTGTAWPLDKPVGYVVCWGPGPDQSEYFPTAHAGGGNLPREKVLSWLRDLLANPDLQVVNHSLKFDLHMAENDDLQVAGSLEDTQVNAALIDENALHYNLDDVARRCGVQPKAGDPLYRRLAERFGGDPDRKTQIGRISQLSGSDPVVVSYATGDGTTTWQVRSAQQEDLTAQNLRMVWAVECRVVRVLQRMERRGVRVNFERAAWLQDWVRTNLLAARRRLPDDFNVRSGPQIEKLFRDSGV